MAIVIRNLQLIQFLITLSFIQGALLINSLASVVHLYQENKTIQYINPSENIAAKHPGIDI